MLDLQACQSPGGRRRGIGRYSLALAKAMAANPRGHDVTVLLNTAMSESIEYLRAEFDGLLPQERLITWDAVAPTAYMDPANTFRRKASETLRLQVLRQLKPDIVHVASMIEGFAEELVATVPEAGEAYSNAATLYDLIPLVHPEKYLFDSRARQWYMEKIEYLRRAEVLLGISRFTCDEAQELLSIPRERLTDISGAADAIFKPIAGAEGFRQELMRRYGLLKPFVMYAGGFDPRKNIGALIQAFALLPRAVRQAHQLAIVGGAPESARLELIALMTKAGVAANEVVFTGYVPDSDLVKLYNLCALYVFPSLQEGFGLPALEAMSSGAIVIGSNTSSLPEVIGHPGSLFDPSRPQAIADKIVEAITDEPFRENLRVHGLKQPLKFSWWESARRAMEAFEAAVERRQPTAAIVVPKQRDSVAFLPAPRSTATGQGIESAVVYADSDCDGVSSKRSLSRFRDERQRYDRVVIELANHPYCAKTLALAVDGASDILLRERTFGAALHRLAAEKSGRELVVSLLYRSGGYGALRAAIDADFSASILGNWVRARSLSTLGQCQLLASNDPGADAMERVGWNWRDRIRNIAVEMTASDGNADASAQDWTRVAMAISRNVLTPVGGPQWLVDISQLTVSDAGTGIQRVVRHVLDELFVTPPPGYRVEPIYLDKDGVFHYARSYCARRYFPGETLPADEVVEFSSADVYLGLDLGAHLVPQYLDLFREMRYRGIKQHFVVYDLLPILRPDCFRPELLPTFRSWYEAVSELADSIVCISRAVADEFETWLYQSMPARQRPLAIGYFHLGADIAKAGAGDGSDVHVHPQLAGLGEHPTFLMVGTIEPRKGHAQTLEAFERLWQQGVEANLLIIGRAGWLSDHVMQRLREHPQQGKQLFWFDAADDNLLLAAYHRASAMLMASEGEGFGLPLIEAAHHGLPLITRDLPVFREIVGEHGYYFTGYGAESLAGALTAWLALDAQGNAPQPAGMRWQTWSESTAQLIDVVSRGHWVHTWMPRPLYRHKASDHRFQTDVGKLVRGRMESRGVAGLLLCGPSVPMLAGHYRVFLSGGWREHSGRVRLDIASESGAQVHARAEFGSEYSSADGCLVELELDLSVDAEDLAIRVEVDAGTDLWIDELVISPWANLPLPDISPTTG
ncbi:glycosyltransferase family 1 protein [Rhodanobacter sp. B05]|uniref:glycosyltransferase family 4 protein n=1 Tax=Rhodanobacter sp. B05 TaxID=1945859 RepID=UPI0020C2AC2F|nr:glycosyltransferase family 1 protein [Rhodanobacter sp. B05]